MLQEASGLGRGGTQGPPEPTEPGKGVRKAPVAALGTARRSGTQARRLTQAISVEWYGPCQGQR